MSNAWAIFFRLFWRMEYPPDKDAPVARQIQRIGSIKSNTILGGLHHHYVRA